MRAILVLLSAALVAGAAQVSFNVPTSSWQDDDDTRKWDFSCRPAANATGHLIFDTVNSLLQHWPNTRYRNGHSIVPGTVPPGTLLYHGTFQPSLPDRPEWVATDPEHSYLFCRGAQDYGCWHLTLVATRPLRVIYFDGSSAAKMYGGTMDSQDLVIWKDVVPDKTFSEPERITELCRIWGDRVDGFVRMEMDFEIMLCDFTKGVEVASFLNLRSTGPIVRPRKPVPGNDFSPLPQEDDRSRPHRPTRKPLALPPPPHRPGFPPRDPPSRQGPHDLSEPNSARAPPQFPITNGFAVFESGAWHNHYPGETRIQLDLTRLVSFYDIASFPSLVAKRGGQERWDHRLEGVTKEEVETLWGNLDEFLNEDAWVGRKSSGVDWKTLYWNVLERYADRLEVLEYLLVNATTAEEAIYKAHSHISTMLAPYILHSAVLPNGTTDGLPSNHSWAASVFKNCATTHTGYISSSLGSVLTPSERLLLRSLEEVNHEICRVLVGLWAANEEHYAKCEGEEGVDAWVRATTLSDLASNMINETKDLMQWLDWGIWVKCRPACGFEEMCYLPTWPFFGRHPRGPGRRPPGSHPDPPDKSERRLHPLDHNSLQGEEDNDWERPQPKCVRRMVPFPIW